MSELLNFLKERLSKPLPGEDAQAQMIPTLSSKKRFSLEAKKTARPGGVMLLFYQKNGEWYFPLIQRPDYDGVHAKQMSFPGGKKDESDTDLTYTALRETHEEIGVVAEEIEVIGHLSDLYIVASNFDVRPTIGFCQESPKFLPDPREVDSVEEILLDDLMNDRLVKEKPINIFNGVTIQAPYFDLNDKVVWGATSMILSELKYILKPFYERS